jgi:putative hydrolase of the HAD superfamily
LFTLFPEVAETLARLRQAGYRMGLVSNWEPRLPELCASHGIWDYFDFAVVSEAEGFHKPHPRLFERALALTGAPANRVLYVGDKLREDVEGGSAVGISVVLIDRGNPATVEYEHRISGLHEIDRFLE